MVRVITLPLGRTAHVAVWTLVNDTRINGKFFGPNPHVIILFITFCGFLKLVPGQGIGLFLSSTNLLDDIVWMNILFFTRSLHY